MGAAGELGMPDAFDTYLMAADYGMLSCQVTGALWWDRHRGLDQIDDLLARREQASDGQFRATTVKLMLDGVCETFTAAMSAPYLDRHGHPTGHQGSLVHRSGGIGGSNPATRRGGIPAPFPRYRRSRRQHRA